ncbi:MAG: Uma2 family endonuclease [Caulobacterales bacterium]
MNAPLPPRSPARPHRFTMDDLRAMVAAGVIEEGAKIELIEGELVDMAAEGGRHTDWVSAVGRWLISGLDLSFVVVPGSTLPLSEMVGPKPDWWVFPAALRTEDVRGPDVLLAIEISDSTLAYDLGEKAALYARHGVRDYWVVQVETRQLYVHRDPAADGYGYRCRFEADDSVAALLIPNLSLALKDLPRVG